MLDIYHRIINFVKTKVAMNDKWKEHVIRQARISGMCTENIKALSQCSTKSEAIELYKRTIDWALEQNYPSLEDIRKYFPDCQSDGIYVDENLNITVSKLQAYVFHNCRGTINVEMDYEGRVIPMLYFSNDCDVTVTCKQTNKYPIRVPIYVYGRNNIRKKDNNNASFVIYELYKEDI